MRRSARRTRQHPNRGRTCERSRPRRESVPRGRAGSSWSSPPTTRPTTSGSSSDRVRAAAPAVDVLVADDNSPDGTGEIADELAAGDPQVHVLHRPGKQGLGAAYLAGFAWAHRARLRRRRGDGRRRVARPGGAAAAARRARRRRRRARLPLGHGRQGRRTGRCTGMLLSRSGNLYIRLALGMPFRDATGGYRAYRTAGPGARSTSTSVASQGYCFQVDLAWRPYRNGFRVEEVPITFAERERGAVKMSRSIVAGGAVAGHRWGVRDRPLGDRAVTAPDALARWPLQPGRVMLEGRDDPGLDEVRCAED